MLCFEQAEYQEVRITKFSRLTSVIFDNNTGILAQKLGIYLVNIRVFLFIPPAFKRSEAFLTNVL